MKTLRFPGHVKHRFITDKEIERYLAPPRELTLEVGAARVKGKKIFLSALLRNESSESISLAVHPYGGAFPYGGDSPFSLQFSQSAGATVKYSGEPFPPEPPRPMSIEIPGAACVQFDAEIDLSHYSYHSRPTVTLDWAFHYATGKHLRGTRTVTLPRAK